MNPDELRALADALEPMAKAPRFEDFDVPAFCAWVRAQADAQPVAWRCEVRGDGTRPALGASDWRHYATTTNERTAQAFLSRCGDGIEGRVVPLTAAPAAPQAEPADRCRSSETPDPKATGPASPERPASNLEDAAATVAAGSGEQAEPIDPHMIVAEDRFPDAQAEPKREPLTALHILEIEDNASRQWRDNGRIVEYAVVFARMIESAHGIGGSDE